MTYLKRWARAVNGQLVPEASKGSGNANSSIDCQRPPENTTKGTEERYIEALELLGWLTQFYNERAAYLEFDAGFPKIEAERLAMVQTKATTAYQRWLELR